MDSGETIFYPRTIHNLSKFEALISIGPDFGDLTKSRSVNNLKPQFTDIDINSLGLDTLNVKTHSKVHKILKHKYTSKKNKFQMNTYR